MCETEAIVTTYQIVVAGRLDEDWSPWLAGFTIRHGHDASGATVTILTGSIADQAALYGVLARLADLNVTLCSVSCSGIAGLTTETEEDFTQ